MVNAASKSESVLVVDASFSGMDHLAAALAEAGLLSCYVRPYANLGRIWERAIAAIPMMGQVFRRTFGRRKLPEKLTKKMVSEVAVLHDVVLALAQRTPLRHRKAGKLLSALVHARTRAIAKAAARVLSNETAVVASWGCAEPLFRRMKERNGICMLNYPFAHHRFARKLLMEEAERQPAFAETLNGHDWPRWMEERFDEEITLADRILVGSSFVRRSFQAEGIPEEKVEVIPYGVDTKLFQPTESITRKTDHSLKILFVGQIGQRKGIAYLLRAYEQFRGPKTHLTLVGTIEGSRAPLQPYVGLFEHIPHVPRSYLPEIYRRADVFVFPTLVEGMPLVVLEAMASGVPVIVTPNGACDIVRDGIDGFVVPIRDIDAIVSRLELLRNDTAMRVSMGQSARQQALEFTWQAYRCTAVAKIRKWLADHQHVSVSAA